MRAIRLLLAALATSVAVVATAEDDMADVKIEINMDNEAFEEPATELGCPECGRMPKYLFNIVLEDTRTRPASFPVVDAVVEEPVSLPEHKETRQRA